MYIHKVILWIIKFNPYNNHPKAIGFFFKNFMFYIKMLKSKIN